MSGAPERIFLIRHAEKPSKDGLIHGVREDGSHDPGSLTPRGWMRAGALVGYFNPRNGFADPRLVRPTHIYAARYDEKSHDGSRRMEQTTGSLAASLGLQPDLRFAKREEAALLADLATRPGAPLVCWSHRFLAQIAQALAPQAPAQWPDERFDLVWILTPGKTGAGWSFEAFSQRLLPGDPAAA